MPRSFGAWVFGACVGCGTRACAIGPPLGVREIGRSRGADAGRCTGGTCPLGVRGYFFVT